MKRDFLKSPFTRHFERPDSYRDRENQKLEFQNISTALNVTD